MRGNAQIFHHVWRGPKSYMTLQLLHYEFPDIYEEKFIFFFISAQLSSRCQTCRWYSRPFCSFHHSTYLARLPSLFETNKELAKTPIWVGPRAFLCLNYNLDPPVLTMVRRCDADGNGYICSEEFHDLCQEFDISQASSRWTPHPHFFLWAVKTNIQYSIWMLPFCTPVDCYC